MRVENVTLPNGYVVRGVPSDVSKEEIKQTAIKNGWATAEDFPSDTPDKSPAASPQLERGRGYIIDQAIRGFGDLASSVLPDLIEDDLLGLDMGKHQNPDGTFNTEAYMAEKAAARDAQAEQILGYEAVQPSSQTERIVGQTARELVSEGPLAIVGSTKKVGSVLGESLFSAVQTASGVLAQDVVHNANKKWELPPMIEEMLASVLAGTTSAGTSVSRGGLNSMFEAGSRMKVNRERVNESVDKATDYLVTSEMNTVVDKATKAQPDIESVISSAQELESQIPGLIVPPAAALADNPIYRKNTEHLLRTDPSFYATAKGAIDTAKKTVTARKEQLFGKADAETDASIRARLPAGYGQKIKQADNQLRDIDTKIDNLVDKVAPKTDSVGVGEAIDSLMTKKVDAVRKKLSPQYERLLTQGSHIHMKPEGVGKVHQAAQLMKFGDNFASHPELLNKIQKEWSPVDAENMPMILGSNGTYIKRPKGDITYPEVSVTEVDSLKRALNKAIRSTTDTDKLRMLRHSKKVLDEAIGSYLPASFVREYKGLDAQYYQELGIPMNTEGVKQLDATRFSETAGNYLSRPEQARDFLDFVGPEGLPVVRDAILIKMDSAGMKKDGTLDAQNLQKFLRKNQRLIETVPGLYQEIGSTAKAAQRLGEDRARLNADYTQRSKELTDGFYKAMKNKKLQGVVNEILNSPAKSEQYFRDIKNFDSETAKMMRQGIRAGILEHGMNAPSTSMGQFLQTHKGVVDRWFGSAYAKDIRYIAAAGDILSKLDIDKMKFSTDFRDQDALSERTGVSAVQLQSVLRDRIAGWGTKLAILGSKMNTSSVQGKRDAAMQELLMNPEALETIRKSVEDNRITVEKPEMVAILVNKLNSAVSKGALLATEGAEGEAEVLRQQQQQHISGGTQ